MHYGVRHSKDVTPIPQNTAGRRKALAPLPGGWIAGPCPCRTRRYTAPLRTDNNPLTMTAATQDRSARLQFLSDWRVLQSGELTAGGILIIKYDPGRLPSFRKSFRGADLWNMEVYLAFHPGDRVEKA